MPEPIETTAPATTSQDTTTSTPAGTNTTTEGTSEEAPFDFAALADYQGDEDEASSAIGDLVNDEIGGAAVAAAPTTPVAPTTVPSPLPATAPVSPAPPVVAAAAAVAPPAQEPPATQPPAAATQPVVPETTPVPPVESLTFEQHRAEFLPKIAALYKMTDEEAEQFRVNPGETLPMLAARVHYEVQAATFNSVLQALPQLVTSMLERKEASDKYDKAFYDKWPVLQGKDKTETVVNSIKAFKAANPKAPVEKVIEQAGLMAAISLGIPLESLLAKPTGAPAPAAQQQAAPSAPPRPVGLGAVGHIQPSNPGGNEDNLFASLAESFLQDGI